MKTQGKKYLSAVCAAIMAALTVFAFGCGGVTGKAYDLYGFFGTQSRIALYADFADGDQSANAEAALSEIEAAFAEIDGAIGLSVETSDVARFNGADAGTELEISAITFELLSLAKEMYAYTDGAYNPSVGLLVDLWGFSPRFNEVGYKPVMPYDRADVGTLPDDKYIDAFRSLLNFGDVELRARDGKYYATKPSETAIVEGDDTVYSMKLDLGGIGKGLAADRARDILAARGITEAYASVGTSSLALLSNNADAAGAPEGNMWSVSLAHPRGGSPYLSVFAKNETGSTSGDYEHFYEIDGVAYCHIIDPATGRPIKSGTATVSLFGRTAADGDALTTALCVMGRDKAIEFIGDKLTDCRVAMVCPDKNGSLGLFTNMDGSGYKLNSDDFPLMSRAENGRISYVG